MTVEQEQMHYIFIAYKPSSDSYCRGCLMESFSSDLVHICTTDREEVVACAADVFRRNMELKGGEVGYIDIHIYYGVTIAGIPIEEDNILEEAHERATLSHARLMKLQQEDTKSRQEAREKAELEERRQQYLELKKEFE